MNNTLKLLEVKRQELEQEIFDHELDSIHEQRSNFIGWISNLECLKMNELMVEYVVPKNKKAKAPNILESKTF